MVEPDRRQDAGNLESPGPKDRKSEPHATGDVTQLLDRASRGDPNAPRGALLNPSRRASNENGAGNPKVGAADCERRQTIVNGYASVAARTPESSPSGRYSWFT